jgi:hypothetical protein
MGLYESPAEAPIAPSVGRAPLPEWTEEEFESERIILSDHVARLRERLMPHVAEHMNSECASEAVSEDWINAAYEALRIELPDGVDPPELERARDAAITALRNSLESKLPSPTMDEIAAHTHELAQCVVSNWVGIITSSVKTALHSPVELDAHWLPTGVPRERLQQGVLAFAADPVQVETVFDAYIQERASAEQHDGVPIAAHLRLQLANGRWVITESANGAQVEPAPAAEVVEQVVCEMLDRTDEKVAMETTPYLAAAELELEADLSAARLTAATVVARESAGVHMRTERDSSSVQRQLARQFADHVLSEWTDFFSPPPRVGLLSRAYSRLRWYFTSTQRPTLYASSSLISEEFVKIVTTEMGMDWKRAHRIVKVATCYASAARSGMLKIDVQDAQRSLDSLTSNITGRVIRADPAMVQFASSVVECALARPGGAILTTHLENRVNSGVQQETAT